MELVLKYLQLPENNLGCLRKADPEIYPNGYAKIVQRDRQPIVFSPEDADVLLAAPPGTFKNIFFYRGNYYVAPFGSEYPYVRLVSKKRRNLQSIISLSCFKTPKENLDGEITIEQLWDRIGSRFSCSSLTEFQAYVRENGHLGIDQILASVRRN